MSSSDSPYIIPPISSDVSRAQKGQEVQRLGQYVLEQVEAEELGSIGDFTDENPFVTARFQRLEERRATLKHRSDEAAREEKAESEASIPIEKLQEVAEQFSQKNPELQAKTLLLLRSRIHKGDSYEEVLRKVREFYLDSYLADEAIDFLLATADTETKEVILKAKEELNQLYDREIKAGRNMSLQSRDFATQGIGTPTTLRDLYREITGNPRDANTLFEELTARYPFAKMKVVIDFMLHSLGADLKAKGPSISRAELTRLFTETRSMQAILGVFRFFQSRMRLLFGSFSRLGMVFPARITFDFLAKLFMRFIREKYPSAEKAIALMGQIGFTDEPEIQMIFLVQYRDAIRQVAPKLFHDERHRQDMLGSFIEALEKLEEELEEEEEEEKEQEKKEE